LENPLEGLELGVERGSADDREVGTMGEEIGHRDIAPDRLDQDANAGTALLEFNSDFAQYGRKLGRCCNHQRIRR
jgi:hypothetical protein